MLTVGSLFAGIGGFDLGLERAGMRSVWQCEIDPFCQRVLAKHWPDVLRVPDVREVGAGTVPYVDVICGGFPCQDLSYAGKGAGIGGERSGLWSEYARVVGELRPRYVVVENVAALLARGLDVVLADLAALGYDAEWDCIPASAVGAPHRRDRIWLVAYPNSDDGRARRAGRPDPSRARQCEPIGALPGADADRGRLEVRSEPDGDPAQSGLEASQRSDADGLREVVADAPRARLERPGLPGRPAVDGGSHPAREPDKGRSSVDADGGRHGAPSSALRARRDGALDAGWWLTEPDVGRVAHGVPARVDRLRSLGNALVPQIAEWIGHRIIEHEESVSA